LLLHAAYQADCTVEKAKDKCTYEEENGEVENYGTEGGTSIVVVLAIGATVTLSTFAHTVHADSTALALAYAFLYFCVKNLDISTVMLLDGCFISCRNCPFDLHTARIASKVARESKFLALNVCLCAATRKGSIGVGRFIKREKYLVI
jgi:hypothetical protein